MRGIDEALDQQRLPAEVRMVAEAALDGEASLSALLAGSGTAPRKATSEAAGPRGPVWLERLRVSGFQGIGQAVELEFDPQPGLTLLIGRNGAGKSSLAEALQIAITRTSSRWEGKTKAWKDGWRNLHSTEKPAVETGFMIEGSPDRLNIHAMWAGSSATPKVTISQGSETISDAALGWNAVLDIYRPFLAYTELGALLGGKSTVAHDALMRGLNLNELDSAIKFLRSEASSRSRVWTSALERAKELREHLKQYDDHRAARTVAALGTHQPQLDVIAEILSGSDPQVTKGMDALRAATAVRPVDAAVIDRAAEELLAAIDARAEVAVTEAGRDLSIAELLGRAISFHSDHGDSVCPVCGDGRLDQDWREQAAQEERSLRARANAATSAERRLTAARRVLEQALPTKSPSLAALAPLGIEVEGPLRGLEALISVRNIEDDRERAVVAVERAKVVEVAFASIREEAEKAMRAQEDIWRALHPRIVAWYHDAREAERAHQWYEPIKAAQKALEQILEALRSERWAPIAAEVVKLWEELRINSNVEIGSPQLAGTATSRRIEYELSVDGKENAALGVMSQGELTALALALFLPRVTLPDSPFKFVILDDPVQSMDMSRVDGLARVLHRLSQHRQIVVLTHDERLREALLRQQIPATIHRVSRAPNSVVSVRKVSTPWKMHLDDALALSAGNIPAELARVGVPVLGRLAIESRCINLIRGRVINAGGSHDDADAIISNLPRLNDMVAYARFGKAERVGDLYGELNRAWGGWSVDTLKACSEGAHGEFSGDARQLAKNVSRFLKALA
jgi:ABC-type Mn2+/Zn2+ transport system ATPase subunit